MIKFVKRLVEYTDDHGTSSEQCSKCKYFIDPHSCKRVVGSISPEGWCKLFKREK